MDIVGNLGFSYFKGKAKAQIEVMDFAPVLVEDKKQSVPINQSIASILGQNQLSL